MTEAINLDVDRVVPVVMQGRKYKITKPGTRACLKMIEGLDKTEGTKARFEYLVSVLVKHSNIPAKVLWEETPENIVLLAGILTPSTVH